MKKTRVINKTVLPNGVKIITKKIPHVRSVSMGVWVNVGARDETIDQSGLSHFIEHMIFKGTARRTAYQIAKEFDAIGGHTNLAIYDAATGQKLHERKVADSRQPAQVVNLAWTPDGKAVYGARSDNTVERFVVGKR